MEKKCRIFTKAKKLINQIIDINNLTINVQNSKAKLYNCY